MHEQQSNAGRPVPQPRDAATVVVVRDGPAGLEVLLLQRAERGDHNSGAWVFPGGLVDAGDREAQALCSGMSDAQASRQLALERGGLAFYLAAIRECFEEAGILFALDARGELASLAGAPPARLSEMRRQLNAGACGLADVCREFAIALAPQRLHYIGHWLTPVGRAKRFDTRFFLAIAPGGQDAMHDAQETMDHVWLPPAQALSPHNARRLMTPTRAMIELLLPHADTRALAAWAAQPRQVERVLPWLAAEAGTVRPVQQHEPAYAEVMKLDPSGRGEASCELRPNICVQLAPHVLRVPAASGGNSYLVGSVGDWLALPPASADHAHLEALVAAARGAIRGVLVPQQPVPAAVQRLAAHTAAALHDCASGCELWTGGERLRVQVTGTQLQCLAVTDRMVFAASAQDVAPSLREAADWLAPPDGFLQPLRPLS